MSIRRALSHDFPAVARLHREVREQSLPYLPKIHTPAEDQRYFADVVARGCETWIAGGDEVTGFVSVSPGWVEHLYVRLASQRRGVGTDLLKAAMADGEQRALWTFQRNAAANRFYLSRGWTPVEHTSGDANAEHEPDTRFVWPTLPPQPSKLVLPSSENMVGFVAALNAGWSPSTERDVSATTLAELREDEPAFFRSLVYGEGMVTIADGTRVKRLPGRVFWISDGAFCGTINFRHVPGTETLPPHVSGHIGYSIVPWKQRRGHATRALAAILPYARETGLTRVLLTCDETNLGSRRVIELNGGVFAGPAPKNKWTYWIDISHMAQSSGGQVREDAP